MPRTSIPIDHQQKAIRMRDDLDLNASYHLRKRTRWLKAIRVLLNNQAEDSEAGQRFPDEAVDRGSALSGITRALLEERGFVIED